jgi:hypothetical protein
MFKLEGLASHRSYRLLRIYRMGPDLTQPPPVRMHVVQVLPERPEHSVEGRELCPERSAFSSIDISNP